MRGKKVCKKEAVLTFQAEDKLYSLTSSPTAPTTYILVPSSLKDNPIENVSCAATEKVCKKEAVLIFQAEDKLYSSTASPNEPTTYILVPSGLKNNPVGLNSCESTSKLCKKEADLTFQAEDKSYSKTPFRPSPPPAFPTTYILLPSGLKNTPVSFVFCAATEKKLTGEPA